MLRTLLVVIIVVAITFVQSCAPSDNEGDIGDFIDSIEDTKPQTLDVAPETMQDIVQNISSPVEMAAVIKEVGVPFSPRLLCSTENPDKYNTNFKKALGLGFMGADLGYLNIYNKTSLVVNYVTVISKLANALKVGQFFDFATLKRLATNNENLDSLMYISVNSFNRMDEYLRKNNRGDQSALVIAGVWLEGMYFATQVVKQKNSEEIAERIGEQKIILNELILILKNYQHDKNFQTLIEDFEEIKKAFKDVEISIIVGDAEAIEKDGQLIIVQNEESVVEISRDELKTITEIVERIRDKWAIQ